MGIHTPGEEILETGLGSSFTLRNLLKSPPHSAPQAPTAAEFFPGGVLKGIIRDPGVAPPYQKAGITSAIDVIPPENETEAYAKAIWGSLEGLRMDLAVTLAGG